MATHNGQLKTEVTCRISGFTQQCGLNEFTGPLTPILYDYLKNRTIYRFPSAYKKGRDGMVHFPGATLVSIQNQADYLNINGSTKKAKTLLISNLTPH